MQLPSGTDILTIEQILGQKVYCKKVEVEVGWLLTLFSDLNWLQGKVEGMQYMLKELKQNEDEVSDE